MSGAPTYVNQSTSVVQIDGSALQNSNFALVYLSSSTTPGHLVTIRDATGYISSPQGILISTTNGITLGASAQSTFLQQRFAYASFTATTANRWDLVNTSPFSNPDTPYVLRSLDTVDTAANVARATALVSSGYLTPLSLEATSTMLLDTAFYASTLYVNTYSEFQQTSPTDFDKTVNGPTKVYGSTVFDNATRIAHSISTGRTLFVGGNISSASGDISVGGDLTTSGSILAPNGLLFTALNISTLNTGDLGLFVFISSFVTARNSVQCPVISTTATQAFTFAAASTIQYGSLTNPRYFQYTPGFLSLVNAPVNTPSTTTQRVAASNGLLTSTIRFSTFSAAETLETFTLGTTQILNSNGNVQLSSLTGNTLVLDVLDTLQFPQTSNIQMAALSLCDLPTGNGLAVDAPPFTSPPLRTLLISTSWQVSSTGTNGTLSAPQRNLNSEYIATFGFSANSVRTKVNTFSSFAVQSIRVPSSLTLTSTTIQLQNATLQNEGGSIRGTETVYASTLSTQQLLTQVYSGTNIDLTAQTVYGSTIYISSATAVDIRTSSLVAGRATLGIPVTYSSINASSAFLIATPSNISTMPFNTYGGLGTYFDRATVTTSLDGKMFYSVVDPQELTFVSTSSRYIDTVLGANSTLGPIGIGGPSYTAEVGTLGNQIGVDRNNTIYYITDSRTNDSTLYNHSPVYYEIRSIQASNQNGGTLSSIAGRNPYYFGDNNYAFFGSISNKMSIGYYGLSSIIVYDWGNQRIRLIGSDGIINTIAGNGFGVQNDQYSTKPIGSPFLYTSPGFLSNLNTAGVCYDSNDGYMYVSDYNNWQVHRLEFGTGTVRRWAGKERFFSNTTPNGGNGQAPLNATLRYPGAIVQDLSRNFYIFDGYNYVVRKVDYATNTTYRYVGDGTGIAGFSGDGGVASSARINVAVSGCVDSNNNLIIADTYNHRIRRIAARTSTITTIAGTGTAGFSGDGGAATAARLNFPRSVAVDYSTGDIYISDSSNNRIRRIAASNGVITTVAGTGAAGAGGDEGLATAATLNQPNTILFEQSSKNLYIADEGNARIRVVDTTSAYIYLFCGFGPNLPDCQGDPECPLVHASLVTFSNPHSVEVTPEGDIYISQSGANPLIRKIDHATGAISNVVGTGIQGWTGDGPALSVRLNQPGVMAYASTTSTLYFSDAGNARVRYYHLPTGRVSTLAGTGNFDYNGTGLGPATDINYPQGIALDPTQRYLYVGDYSNYLIRRVDLTSQAVANYAGTPGDTSPPTYGTLATNTTIRYPDALAVTQNGDLYIAGLRGLEVITASNGLLDLAAASNSVFRGDRKLLNSNNTYVNSPKGVRVDLSDAIILSDNSNFRIRKTYSSGFINAIKYLNLSATYRWGRSNTLGSIVMNGTTIFSYDGITGQDSTFTLTNYDVETLPIVTVDPVRFTNTPWFSIDLRSSDGFSQLAATAWMQQSPGQATSTASLVDCNGGLQLNTGVIRWPSSIGGITMNNPYNDLETRRVTYTGSLTFASDPFIKEEIRPAALEVCVSSFEVLPLKRYEYCAAYRSTFAVQDRTRLGFLTTDVAQVLPKSIAPLPLEHAWISTPVNSLDLGQVRYLHLGTTQTLLHQVSTLEAEVEALRAAATQRTALPR